MVDKDRAERFVSNGIDGMSFGDSKCDVCKHVHENGYECDAFPDGIPVAILGGDTMHDEKYPGDKGIQFERVGS